MLSTRTVWVTATLLTTLLLVQLLVEYGGLNGHSRAHIAFDRQVAAVFGPAKPPMGELDDLFTFLKRIENISAEEAGKLLDKHPYPPDMWREGFPSTEIEKKLVVLDDPPPAPTGAAAIKLADSFGWPRHWQARHRPELFILGPPKSGTTFLEGCFRVAMTGNSSKKLYPDASMRWPRNRGPGGEPIWEKSPNLEVNREWGRTDFRRWDTVKEWWAYPVLARRAYNMRGFRQPHRFPPVEKESNKWVVMDSTPDQIMIPEAAVALKKDLEGSPFDPTFLVMKRGAVSRGYSHYLLFTDLRSIWGWRPDPIKVFSEKLEYELKVLMNTSICRAMVMEPEKVVANFTLTTLALQNCMYDTQQHTSQVLFLSFGFTALGVRYWFEHFNPKFFKFMELSEVAKMNNTHSKMFDFFEDTFPGMKRLLPKCDDPSKWNSGNCTGPLLYERAMTQCGDKSDARTKQAWTKKGVPGYSKGEPEDLAKFEEIAERWSKVFDDLVESYGQRFYKIPDSD